MDAVNLESCFAMMLFFLLRIYILQVPQVLEGSAGARGAAVNRRVPKRGSELHPEGVRLLYGESKSPCVHVVPDVLCSVHDVDPLGWPLGWLGLGFLGLDLGLLGSGFLV